MPLVCKLMHDFKNLEFFFFEKMIVFFFFFANE